MDGLDIVSFLVQFFVAPDVFENNRVTAWEPLMELYGFPDARGFRGIALRVEKQQLDRPVCRLRPIMVFYRDIVLRLVAALSVDTDSGIPTELIRFGE